MDLEEAVRLEGGGGWGSDEVEHNSHKYDSGTCVKSIFMQEKCCQTPQRSH